MLSRGQAEDEHRHDGECGHGESVQLSAVEAGLRTPGRPLAPGTRARMEGQFGADLSGVRLHTGTAAQEAATAVQARAFTVDQDIVIGKEGGDFKTLNHELAHVVRNQQRRSAGRPTGGGFNMTRPRDPEEREAETNAARISSGGTSTVRGDGPGPASAHGPGMPVQRTFIQRAPRSSSDEFDDGGFTEQDLFDSGRARFVTLLYGEFVRSGRWDVSGTQGPDGIIAHFTASKRPKKRSRPRAFAETPQVKELRRVSTAIKAYLRNQGFNPVEVQAGIGTRGQLLVAANDTSSNNHLQNMFRHTGAAQVLGTMIEDTRQNGLPGEPRNQQEIHERGDRQHRKVKPQLDSPLNLPALRGALAAGITVATDGEAGLHAERRIAARNGGVVPDHLGGTKRPCPSCVAVLYPEGDQGVHPGIFRSDDVSNIGFPEYDHNDLGNEEARAQSMFQKINSVVENTYVTVTKRGVEVPEVGSESDSEPD
ncbi:DUF4157 domain-containing protein [Streptomyces sp. LP11]|uniref:DUF4157 domain-containing protein n=1 Tax=Streptomyces pyxinicus TaxID=2970331 RepID=A0ABT2BAY9_9ACTN|nr:DUF4157 domain-containing protein [Streptomyces sp. LP11]MCS0605585.1 DUF4157 domain-containing protein [Streptomyces sp. LP11]